MGPTFLMAFALMLVLEGVLPFVAPTLWRDTFRRITAYEVVPPSADGQYEEVRVILGATA